MESKRRHERFTITSVAVVTVQSSDGQTRSFEGNVFNISLSGMGLCASESVEGGDRIHALLIFVDSDGAPREEAVEGTVVWHREMESFHIIGIEFEELTPEDHPGLYRSLKDRARWLTPGIG